jgi:dTDP-4-dehydrorhamnose reductase
MKVLILGNGFVGNAIKVKNPDFYLKSFSEFNNDKNIESYDIIINTIGYTDVKNSNNDSKCYYLNTSFPLELLSECEKKSKYLIHFSSGCLYGSGGPFDENEPIKTDVSMYYWTKGLFDLQGSYSNNCCILRPRLIFGENEHKSNLITKIKSYKSVDSQLQSFTSVDTISESIPKIIDKKLIGIYNIANSGYYIKNSYNGIYIVDETGYISCKDISNMLGENKEVKDIISSSPIVKLNCKKLEKEIGKLPYIQDELTRMFCK